MVLKYKVNEVAKDLNINSNEVIELLSKYSDKPKKAQTVLTAEELNIVFDYFTQKNQVDTFDGYFAMQRPKEEPKKPAAEKAEPKKEQISAEKPKKEEPAKQTPKKTEEKKPAAEKKAPAKEERKKADEKKPEHQKNHPVQPKKPVVSENLPKTPIKVQPPKQQQKKKGETHVRGEQVVKTVDTRGSYVELDKYNDKYERYASEAGGNRNETFRKKQKIGKGPKQKGQYGSKKETEQQRLNRLQLEKARKQQLKVSIPDEIVVSELASRLKVTASEVIKKLMGLGVMAGINATVDFDTASLVAEELGAKVEKEVVVTIEERLIDDREDREDELVPRSPIIVVMGHVDHGKTSLLDKIRNSNVTAGEAGGITQHIGAYKVKTNGREITFLDTPGHEAFTSMRARGAQVTDIVILVVAADDGIMPQTVEAINHAKAAGVSIIVAINKMDKEGANPERVKQELTEHGLIAEEWGGDTICVPISALTGEGIDTLLEMVTLVADVKELKANPDRLAKGTVVEARLDKGKGPVATLLVQNGTLRSGDIIIAGTTMGKVRVMTDDKGRTVKEAGPSTPVEITGLSEVPSAGDVFNAVEDEHLAKELVEERKHNAKQEEFKSFQKVTLDNLFSQIEQGDVKELPIVVKADVKGSVEAVTQSLEKLSNDEVRVKVIHGGVGAVSESDVMLANASNAIIVGFNVRPNPVAADNAKRDGVDIRLYRIIYDAIEEIETAMKGMLAPKFREVEMGRIEVRQVMKLSSAGIIAGSYVLDGKITRQCRIRVVRDGIIVAEDKIDSLRRFKDDVKEVAQGFECGVGLEKFSDIKEGDIFEAFIMEEYRD
ncbi:MAG: translation initiation factor IF-2 [Oscillospiraceae bacterium]